MTPSEAAIAGLLRELAPRVLGVLVRRNGNFDDCEDAVQEALLAAAVSWPVDGVPNNPTGWLITTASRRLVEIWRKEAARRRREDAYALEPAPGDVSQSDDTLALLFLCCHPELSVPSQVALTLRALGGLTTAEIARALLLPEATVGQRISRAKARIRDTGAQFRMPTACERDERLPAVLHTLYLIFNEGYTATSGQALNRVELTSEAIRLTRQLRVSLPDEGEVAGLLALMLLTDARRDARTGPDGSLIPLAEQDRRRWDRTAIAEGIAIIEATLPVAKPGPYQLQAAIAAVHDEAADAGATDWPQILALYDVLAALAPGPMVALNRTVAIAMVRGPAAALAELNDVAADPALGGHHRVDAVRAHLLDELGDREAAREYYLRAAQRTRSLPERSYLLARATR
ncbi:sigma-70 family RNA polymerase sigma factor [Mycobacterium sp. IS-1264]|uniref:RNA polymerase sigma factor n=1 Tax=Mycobacterium sp. IS-1264 TaxID=1834158 RepID=UPI00197BE069|nr:sigma-70 family RNA polymerase sigma factor [Mycobacterium sp. IS-1264]